MDTAYDHIQEEAFPDDPPSRQEPEDSSKRQSSDFNSEIQDAYKAISSSPWAARLGGFLGSVKKQGEQYYENASKQLPTARENASAGISSLINRTRSLSVQATDAAAASSATKDDSTTSTGDAGSTSPAHPARPDSLPADIVKEAEGMLSRFKSEAAKRLKDIEKAEDAADEALLKFGSNIRNFLRDAVVVAPPTSPGSSSDPSKVLFESKDSEGKRVIHTTRFDAQLHVIHSSLDSFLKDPVSPEWAAWSQSFDVDQKTEAIAKDLEKHEELRRAMEKLVPEKTEYASFWTRYYFLRHVIESEEQKRRDMLKASAPIEEEEVAWASDSEEDEDSNSGSQSATPQKPSNLAASKETLKPAASASTPTPTPTSISTPAAAPASDDDKLKPAQPRNSSDEKSVADSDASYDLVSGATSRAPGSPQDKKKDVVNEESDEEDWE